MYKKYQETLMNFGIYTKFNSSKDIETMIQV